MDFKSSNKWFWDEFVRLCDANEYCVLNTVTNSDFV